MTATAEEQIVEPKPKPEIPPGQMIHGLALLLPNPIRGSQEFFGVSGKRYVFVWDQVSGFRTCKFKDKNEYNVALMDLCGPLFSRLKNRDFPHLLTVFLSEEEAINELRSVQATEDARQQRIAKADAERVAALPSALKQQRVRVADHQQKLTDLAEKLNTLPPLDQRRAAILAEITATGKDAMASRAKVESIEKELGLEAGEELMAPETERKVESAEGRVESLKMDPAYAAAVKEAAEAADDEKDEPAEGDEPKEEKRTPKGRKLR